MRAGGNAAAVDRYERELAPTSPDALAFEDDRQQTLLASRARTSRPQFLAAHADGAVVRVSCTLKEVEAVMESFPGPAVARAGSGVCYGYFERSQAAGGLVGAARADAAGKAVIEFAPEEVRKRNFDLWPAPGGDLEIMRRVKKLFDPRNLLNRGRLYRRI